MSETETTTEAAPAAAPAEAPAAAPAAPEPTPAAPTPWHKSYDEETRGWIENKGWHQKSPDEALKSLVQTARNAESKFGVEPDRLLKLPMDMTNKEQVLEVYNRLGRPESASEYGIEVDDGDDPESREFINDLLDGFHGAGLTKDQAKEVFGMLEGKTAAINERNEKLAEEKGLAGIAELQQEWGDTFELNRSIASEAAKATGATEEEINALEGAMESNAAVIRLFQRIGAKRGLESGFVSGNDSGVRGATTPDGAKAKIAELKADPEWAKSFTKASPDSALVKEYRNLVKIATAGR